MFSNDLIKFALTADPIRRSYVPLNLGARARQWAVSMMNSLGSEGTNIAILWLCHFHSAHWSWCEFCVRREASNEKTKLFIHEVMVSVCRGSGSRLPGECKEIFDCSDMVWSEFIPSRLAPRPYKTRPLPSYFILHDDQSDSGRMQTR